MANFSALGLSCKNFPPPLKLIPTGLRCNIREMKIFSLREAGQLPSTGVGPDEGRIMELFPDPSGQSFTMKEAPSPVTDNLQEGENRILETSAVFAGRRTSPPVKKQE